MQNVQPPQVESGQKNFKSKVEACNETQDDEIPDERAAPKDVLESACAQIQGRTKQESQIFGQALFESDRADKGTGKPGFKHDHHITRTPGNTV